MTEILSWLQQQPEWGQLPLADLQAVADGLRWHDLRGGDEYCAPGDQTARAFLVVAGGLSVFVREANGHERLTGELGGGELFAELNLLYGTAFSAGARATCDTVGLELTAEAFTQLMKVSPAACGTIIRMIVDRDKPNREAVKRQRTVNIALIPLSGDLNTNSKAFSDRLRKALATHFEVACVTEADACDKWGANATESELGSLLNRELVIWLSEAARDVRYMVYVGNSSDTLWTQRAVRQADRVLLLGHADANPTRTQLELSLANQLQASRSKATDLVLFYDEGSDLLRRSLDWTAPRGLSQAHFVRANDDRDWALLAKQMVNQAAQPQWLQSSQLFDSLAPEELRALMAEIQQIQVDGRHDLFKQGDAGNALYIVISGRLQAVISFPDGSEKVVGEMGPGDVIGEISLISGEPRTATIRAIRDSSLAVLSKESFDRLAQLNPTFVFRLARVLADRLAGKHRRHDSRRSLNFAVVPLSKDFETLRLVRALSRGFEPLGSTTSISAVDVERRIGRGATEIDKGDHGDAVVVEWLNRMELSHDYVLYQCDAELTPWTRRCLRHADRLLLVGSSNGRPEVTELERTIFDVSRLGTQVPSYLVLVHPDDAREGSGTRHWLEPRKLDGHYHVRLGCVSDMERTARLLARQAIGLVLGGGGSRGVAHVGVARAMSELKIPIDVVSGTSAGAGIAGLIALGDSVETMADKCCDMVTQVAGHFWTLCRPLVAMMSGRHPNRLLNPWFHESLIEDQFIPCSIVSVDLVSGEPCIHRTGSLWKATRASSSLPAAWPPITDGGRLLVDGGVLNNLPIDVVKPVCAQGTIVASDISSGAQYDGFHEYGYELSGWSELLRKLIPFSQGRRLPSMMSVISRCCTLASESRIQQLIKDERVRYLQPPVTHYAMFDIRTEPVVFKVEQTSYSYAMTELKEWAASRGFKAE